MRKLLAFVAVVAVAACDSRVGTPFIAPVPTIVGTFALRTFNGKTLPTVTDQSATSTLTLVGDTLTFTVDGQLRRATASSITTPPAAATPRLNVATGTYVLKSSQVTLTLPSASGLFSVTGTLSGSQITVPDAGDVWVYVKR